MFRAFVFAVYVMCGFEVSSSLEKYEGKSEETSAVAVVAWPLILVNRHMDFLMQQKHTNIQRTRWPK